MASLALALCPLISGWRGPLTPRTPPPTLRLGERAPSFLLSRRSALLHSLAAPLLAVGTSAYAFDDPLTLKLKKSREELVQCPALIEAKQWDDVRQKINALLPFLTFKGYTGESVKSRALSWARVGEIELSDEIVARRRKLVLTLSSLDTALFAAQTNKPAKMLTPQELQDTLSEAIEALDSLIAKLGCETRVVSGACEILPTGKSTL